MRGSRGSSGVGGAGEPVRYVAIGDSFTEGIGDDTHDGRWGWASQVAAALAARSAVPVLHANLAIRGRTLSQIVAEQLETVLTLSPAPTLLSFCGGGNDLLRPGFSVQTAIRQTEHAIDRCLDVGVDVVLLSPADPSDHLPFGRTIHRRGHLLATANARLAERKSVPFVDVSHDLALRHRRFWSADRLHLNVSGHTRVSEMVLAAVTATEPPPAPVLIPASRPAIRDELRYLRTYVVPWLGRRLRGTSSGDGRSARVPRWVEVGLSA